MNISKYNFSLKNPSNFVIQFFYYTDGLQKSNVALLLKYKWNYTKKCLHNHKQKWNLNTLKTLLMFKKEDQFTINIKERRHDYMKIQDGDLKDQTRTTTAVSNLSHL